MRLGRFKAISLTGCILLSTFSIILTTSVQLFDSKSGNELIRNLSEQQNSALGDLSTTAYVEGRSDDPSGVVWGWAEMTSGSFGAVSVEEIALDLSGNAYVTGGINGTVSFGSINLVSGGYYDIFIAKLSSSGSWQWAITIGGESFDFGRGIAVDPSGDVYVTGGFNGTVNFGDTVLTSTESDAFIAKLSSSGSWQWVIKAGGFSSDFGQGISVDPSGNAYVTGYFAGEVTFGSTNLTSNGTTNIFIAKVSTSGLWQWAVNGDSLGSVTGAGIETDVSGNAYVTGNFMGETTFGSTNLTSNGSTDIFIAKVSNSGLWQWAVSVGGSGYDLGQGIAVDSSGNSYITGMIDGTVNFGIINLTSHGETDIFIGKLSSNGLWQWAVNAGSSHPEYGNGIAVDSSDNAYVTGRFQGNALFGDTSLVSNGGYDAFILKISSTGSWQWVVKVGGTSYDTGSGIAVHSSGNTYVTGTFEGNASFGRINLTTSGWPLFITQLSPDSDSDGVADSFDLCPGYDDRLDADDDEIPDSCDPLFNEAKTSVDLVKTSFTDKLSQGDLDAIGVMLAILLPLIGILVSKIVKRKKIFIVNTVTLEINQAQSLDDFVKISAELESIIANDKISQVQYQSLINKIEERKKSFNHEPLISSNISMPHETKNQSELVEHSVLIQDSAIGGDYFVGSTKIDNQIINDPEVIARTAIQAYKLGTVEGVEKTILPRNKETLKNSNEHDLE